MQKIETFVLYIIIIILSTSFAFASQKRNNALVLEDNKYYITKKVYFFTSILIPWFFVAFTKVGVDYKNYYRMIERMSWSNYSTISHYEEPIFNALCMIIKTLVGGNTDATIFGLKTLTIFLFGLSLYLVKDRIRIGYSVFVYMILFYLPSFYLLGSCLAASVVFVAFSIWSISEKILIPGILIFLAAQLHNSAYLIIPSFIFLIIIQRKSSMSKLLQITFTFGYISAIFLATTIFEFAKKYFSWFHYSGYIGNGFSGTGIMVIIKYIPLCLMIYVFKLRGCDAKINKSLFVFVLTSFIFNVLSYSFNVIQRVEYMLLPLYTIFIPEAFEVIGPKISTKNGRVKLFHVLVLIYVLFRGYLIFDEFFKLETGLTSWSFFWPF